jgi:hypothetical protein
MQKNPVKRNILLASPTMQKLREMAKMLTTWL